jgi:2-polyprenyl-6-methoxyphenol hydroxylase-like FAD-dependent oxidoreductase
MQTLDTEVVIVGAGPAGLMLAIELGCRGIACIVLEQAEDAPRFPKANATSARTMEHFRRRGFSAEVRALGLPADYPQDIVYCTRIAAHELARFAIPSRGEAATQSTFGDYGNDAWPTPELPHRAQQMVIEPILRAQAGSYPSVTLKAGVRATALAQDEEGVEVLATSAVDGTGACVRALYAVGCDGARSMVRKGLGVSYGGTSGEQRDFFGGQMLSLYFRSSDLYGLIGKKRAWQYWALNAQQRGLLIAVDGVETFVLAVQLRAGEVPEGLDLQAVMRAVIGIAPGVAFDLRPIGHMPWSAGYALVAERMARKRIFIAGDAAHLFTPTGGMGYNTSVDDAVNLGWKLALAVRGQAGPQLLDSYERERRPIAERNTAFARRMADSIGRIGLPEDLEDATAQGMQARTAMGAALAAHVAAEFNTPGLQLGLRYEDSPVVAQADAPRPQDLPNRYVPNAVPGARAPHALLGGVSLFDSFGRDFTLLAMSAGAADPWKKEAAALGLELHVVATQDHVIRDLYGAEAALIRPDHHIAWRGLMSTSARAVLRMATGHPAHDDARLRAPEVATP